MTYHDNSHLLGCQGKQIESNILVCKRERETGKCRDCDLHCGFNEDVTAVSAVIGS